MTSIVLASQSPRRQELLAKIVPTFQVQPAAIDERVTGELSPEAYVLEMAQKKAQYVFKQHPRSLIIGSDTIVTIDGEILGKPQDDEEAFATLTRLSGRDHMVHTGLYMMTASQIEQQIVSAKVSFFPLTAAEIETYLATGEHRDKAGAYGIQGAAAFFVKKIEGDYYAIVGFPIAYVKRMLAKFKR